MWGELEEARSILLRLGQKRFGAPGTEVIGVILGQEDLSVLHGWIDRVLEVNGWEELLSEGLDG